ncbi:Htur_1727 family rSAM-partnered candidate RiPP [Natronosalvus vescus]|uniref:Htur_1727 family rSAM-partnered candidate RiPP n=1 Tax=Natronosalvus vescus TaxID=2953881 RepID=UPI00209192DD|nr:Htur_1727 family rSAM-partnered candidate RiPP [Natronosalvus vescus]
MDERTRWSKVAGDRRGTPIPQWEVFQREQRTSPLQHVGSVTAYDADRAVDHATSLFGATAEDLWLCPADAIERYSTRPLSAVDEEFSDDGQTFSDEVRTGCTSSDSDAETTESTASETTEPTAFETSETMDSSEDEDA